jgi:hypothetical protein
MDRCEKDLPDRVGRDLPSRICHVRPEHGRIKKKPPTPVEVARIASDMVMNDGNLRHRMH